MTFTEAEMDARVCRNIARYRERAGLSQDRLGVLLTPPVRRNEISRWENKKPPKISTLLQIADVLGVDPGLFYVEPA